MVAFLQVSLTEAKGLRKSGARQPDVTASIRIVEKQGATKQPDPVFTIVTQRTINTCNPLFDEGFTLSFPGLGTIREYQLEVALWDQSGADKSLSDQNFLGEVILNLAKLKDWDGVVLDQEFELRQGRYLAAVKATGKLQMKLKYQSEQSANLPIGLSLVVYQNWSDWAARLQQSEAQLCTDLVSCLRTDSSRIEFIASERGQQEVVYYGQRFNPAVCHVNILAPISGGRDTRAALELEALIMTLLKDTRSEIYSINTQIREIVIHEYYPKPTKAPTNAPKNAPAPTHAPAPAAVIPPRQEDAKPAFIRRPIRNGEGEIEVDESRAGPRRLEISLLRARHLPKFDRLGTIDGYCMLNFAGKDFETKVVKNTYSPDWNEKFTFEIDDVSKRPSAVSITVMDWDRLSKNEKVGEIVITSERMWDVLRTRDNWTEERERGIINNKMPVVGNDKQNSEVTIAIKVLEPTEKQKEAWNLAQAKLKGPEVKIPVPVVQQVATSVPNAAKATAPTATAIKTPNKGPCRLELTIVRARHLPKMDTFNSIDAYCFAEYGDHTYKTEVKKNTYSPDWNAVEVFKIYDMSQVKKPLSITLFDWNAVGKNDKVGQVLLGPERISNLLVNGFGWQEEKDFNIVNDSGKEVIGNDSSKSIITLKVRILEPTPQQLQQYVDAGVVPSAAVSTVQPTPPKVPTKAPGRLELTILRGRHMPKMDMLQSIDTFCTVDFAGQTFKTEVRKNTYSPDWNAVDVFRIDDMSQVKNPLYLTVYDWDTVKKNDKVGQVTLLPADISRVLANGYGWQEEAEYSIINDQGREVIGNDKLKSVISLKLKVLEPVPDQLQQFAKAQPVVTPLVNKTKLSAQGLPGPKTEITPPSIPSAPKAAVDQERALAIQRASELAKAQTLAIAQAQAKAAAEAKALQESKASAARDTAEAEAVVAARTKKHAEKVIISKEVDKVIPPPHPSEQVDRKQQPWGDLNLGSVQRNSEVCDKSCSEMQSMLNSIRVIKLHA